MTSLQTIRDFNTSHLAPESTIYGVADEALGFINDALAASSLAQIQFKDSWNAAFEQYEEDIAVLDQELSKIPPSLAHLWKNKERRRKDKANVRNSRFRLGLSGVGGSTCTNLIPIQPPRDDISVASSRISSSKRLRSKGEEEQDKILARSALLEQMSTMREYEIQLENKLSGSGGTNNEMTDQERKETKMALLRLRTANCEKVIDMITAYKPRFNPRSKKDTSSVSSGKL